MRPGWAWLAPMPPTTAARWTTASGRVSASMRSVSARQRRSQRPRPTASTLAPRALSSRCRWRPKNPVPPVTTTVAPARSISGRSFPSAVDPHGAPGQLVLEQGDVGVDHEPDELVEAGPRLPAEHLPRLGGVAAQVVHLGWA